MKRLLLILSVLLLSATLLGLTWLTTSEAGLRWAYQQAQPLLPTSLSISQIDGRLIGPITLKDVHYQQGDLRIESTQLSLDWLPSALFAATITITRLEAASLQLHIPEHKKGSTHQAISLPDINLPWRVILNNVLINGLSIKQNQHHHELQQLKLNASSLFNRVNIKQLSLQSSHYNVAVKGTITPSGRYPHALEIDAQLKLPEQQQVRAQGTLQGDTQQSQLTQQLTGALSLTLQMQLNDLLDQFTWQGTLHASAIDSHIFNQEWPAISGALELEASGDLQRATLTGHINGQATEIGPFKSDFSLQRLTDNTLQIDHLTLQSPRYQSQLSGRGQWWPASDGGKLAVALHWQNLRWPLTEPTWFDSAIGSAWLEGSLDNYRIAIASERPQRYFPESNWYASATGDQQGIHVESLRINALDGEGHASGHLSWSPQLVWQADMRVSNLNPATLWPAWQGELDGELSSHGQYIEGQLHASANVSQLQGQLRDYPLSISSQLTWQNNGLDINTLSLHSADTQLNASGRLAEQLNLAWSLNSPDLAQLHPKASGSLQAEGAFSGTRQTPLLTARLSGKQLQLSEYEISHINGTAELDLFQWKQPNIQVDAQALRYRKHKLQSLSLNAQGEMIEIATTGDQTNMHIKLNGKIEDNIWQGEIVDAQIHQQSQRNWHLQQPAALTLSPQQASLAPACLLNDLNENSHGCFELYKASNQWRGQLDAQQIPLALLAPWLPNKLTLAGEANLQAQLQQDSELLSGNAQLTLHPGVIGYPILEGEQQQWPYRHGELNITLTEQGIHGDSQLTLNNGDQLSAKLTLPDANLLTLVPSHQPLLAEAQLTLNDLKPIGALIPEVQTLQGQVSLKLRAGGTIQTPSINGQAQLLNGSLRIPRLGITIEQISLQAKSEAQHINYTLDAHSADGRVNITGQTTLNRRAGWPTELTIKGEKFEVSRIPEARVVISPDLQVKLQNRSSQISGELHIPYAKLQPKDISSAERLSDDVVIIGAQQSSDTPWSLSSQIHLTLGERVHLYGFGFEGRLGGKLLLQDQPGQLTRATGEINVPEGRYRAYGQRLDVEHGRLLYTGGPLSNPGLDLRCVRHINEVTAGLNVKGSLTKPQLELFSNPAMGETDALAYLLLGRPIENASGEEGAMMSQAVLALGLIGGDRLARSLSERFGLDEMRVESSDTGEQASLVIGHYLSPKLYLSYGVGLIEAVNTFNLRYQLTDRWQLKGESGETQGADLFYTFERE